MRRAAAWDWKLLPGFPAPPVPASNPTSVAFTDGKARGEGTTEAYAPSLTWANPALTSLEEQALVPMLGENPVELGLKGREAQLLETLRRDPAYQTRFPAAFAGDRDPFTLVNVTKAIAAFERTIVSMRSPYDRYRWGGDRDAISAAAKRGEMHDPRWSDPWTR